MNAFFICYEFKTWIINLEMVSKKQIILDDMLRLLTGKVI